MSKSTYESLKDTRKVLKKYKIIDYNGKYKELVEYDKGFYVYPKNDALLDMINDIDLDNYNFKDLPYRLQKYMKSIDDLMFNIAFKEYENQGRALYDKLSRREEILYNKVKNPSRKLYEEFVIQGGNIESDYKKAKRSARRSYKKVDSLIKCNIDNLNYFITLTFADKENHQRYKELSDVENFDLFFEYVDGYDLDQCIEVYKKFVRKIMTNFSRKDKDFLYITVWEKMKSGKYHFHILCNDIPQDNIYKIPEWLAKDFVKHKGDTQNGLKYWKWGKSEVQKVREHRKMGKYVTKYIIKGFKHVNVDEYNEYLNKKKYFASHKLAKPNEIYSNDDELDKYFDLTVSPDIEIEYDDYLENKIKRKLVNT